ncbi:response regulator [Malaciobacter marinus]|uniref:Chemotaxis regulatory protein n=1 Tax=Malaciobacter marinus TaxID=505249 RepID=A0A347TNP1_9BACT|nr:MULTISPECIES: response regulator [Malaciobacter]AXX88219.1 chemotaxis regulatory protein [Malaciobacter marinus]PHO13922.1 response regulator [Malaciobacter marinus]PHO15751.1 response regulator [Malaciobacter marinus]RYA24425.1 response regulator [Malaciobacter halophilus]
MSRANLKILYVDDSTTILDMLSSSLIELGYLDTKSAEDGIEALALCEDEEFDLIITDINMPNMNGFEFIENLRNKYNYMSTPILVLTTESSDEMKEKGYQVGATSWMVKPFTTTLLDASIEKTIEKTEQLDSY